MVPVPPLSPGYARTPPPPSPRAPRHRTLTARCSSPRTHRDSARN